MVKQRKKVLLAVDGSDQAFAAVRYASQLFPSNLTEIVFFHSHWEVKKDPAFKHRHAFIADWAIEQERAIQEFFEKGRQLFLERGVPRDALSVKIMERKLGIVRDVFEESKSDYDAVVVGRQGMSKLKDSVLGSIAYELIGCLTHVPLCVVGGTPQVGKMLCAMDASEGAMKALDCLSTMLDCKDWQVSIVHVIKASDSKIAEAGAELQKAKRAAETCLEKAVCHLEEFGLSRDRITTEICTGMANCPRAIVKKARDGGYGTIVVGRRGLSGVKKLFLGRVSNKVLKLAKEMAVWVVS